MKLKYKVGDKVRIVDKWPEGDESHNYLGKMDHWLGKEMTIRAVLSDGYRMIEDQEEHLNGWYWAPQHIAGLATACSSKIVITSDGKTTTAKLYEGKKVVSTALAECSPSDTFNFKTGATLAVVRLLGKQTLEEKPADRFPRELLTEGVFGFTSDGDAFVVVGDSLVFRDGLWLGINELDEDGMYLDAEGVDRIVESFCFTDARGQVNATKPAKVLYIRPGTENRKY